MNPYGLPPNSNLGGFARAPESPPLPPNRPSPPIPPRYSASGLVTLLLILACIAVGALFAWGRSQQRERVRLADKNRDLGQAYTVVVAQRDDLAHFVADPSARMSRLTGRAAATGRAATIAWNADRRTGFVLAEQMPLLPDGQRYRVWARSAGDKWTPTAGAFFPQAGLTCVEFHALATAPPADKFVIAVEPAGAHDPLLSDSAVRPALPPAYE